MRGVSDVVDEFVALAKRTKRHKDAYERGLAEMYTMLPAVRQARRGPDKLGPTKIEELSERLIPRDTISRRTAPVIGTSRKRTAQS